jgi:hypothetical protein
VSDDRGLNLGLFIVRTLTVIFVVVVVVAMIC